MVQNSYTILTSGVIFLVSLILFIFGLIKKNRVFWIPALIFGLLSAGYILIMLLIRM